ncbi:MAG: HAD family phosphatase [Cyanobacteria bacterium J06639_1]
MQLDVTAIRAAIFDMDGLMLDTEPIYRKAWLRATADMGYQLADDFYSSFVGRSNDDCDRLMQATFGEDLPIEKLRERRDFFWRETIREDGVPLRPGLLKLLDWLEEREIPKAIATASDRAEADISLSATDIMPRFHSITAGNEVANNKPAPDIYLEAARKLGVAPEYCIAFEDSNAGAIAATAAGIPTILVPDLQTPAPETLSRVFAVFPSLLDARTMLAAEN